MAGLARSTQIATWPASIFDRTDAVLTVDDAAKAAAAEYWSEDRRRFVSPFGADGVQHVASDLRVRIWDEDGQQYTRIVRPVTEFEVEWTEAP